MAQDIFASNTNQLPVPLADINKPNSYNGTISSNALMLDNFSKISDSVGFSQKELDFTNISSLTIGDCFGILDTAVISVGNSQATMIDTESLEKQSNTSNKDSLLGQILSVGVTDSLTTTSSNTLQNRAQMASTSGSVTSKSDPNGSIATALNAGKLVTKIQKTGTIGRNESHGRDSRDYWKFSILEASRVNFSLKNLEQAAGLAIYNNAGKLLTWSNRRGNSSESINRWLGAGNYYAMVYSEGNWGGQTNYTLNINAGQTLDNFLIDHSLTMSIADDLNDGYLNRVDIIDALRSTKDFGSVHSTEIKDLRNVLKQANNFGIEDYVENLMGKVVNGDAANAQYKGATLGNLYSGASSYHMEKLVSEHFYGTDRPDAKGTYRYTSGSLFQSGINYTDVDQGAVGDCYFLAGLGAVAHKNIGFIKDMFTDNRDGTFTVRFFKDGKADYVTVDRYLPFNSDGNFVYANNSSGKKYNDTSNELWVALAEKAYAQVNESKWIGQDGTNSYNGISGGWSGRAMRQVTGLKTRNKGINISSMINSYFSGEMVTVNTKDSGVQADIVGNHSYVMVGYNHSTEKFKLYNPWGGFGSTINLNHSEIQANFSSWDHAYT